jgi:8-oxo-dGTP pyrophosphatase MutT (NUDIX family)
MSPQPRIEPRITVAALIEREGRLLTVEERVGDALVLNQPAGHLEAAETLEEAVVREVLEETGYDCRPTALVGVYLWPSESGRTVLRVAFACQVAGSSAGPKDPDIVATHWLTRAELARGRVRSALVLASADDYLAGRRFPLDVLRRVAS